MYMRERINCDRIEDIFRNRTKDGQSGCPAVTEIITVSKVNINNITGRPICSQTTGYVDISYVSR